MPRPASRHIDDHDEPVGMMGSALGVVARRPVDTLACLLAAACTVMIFVNALALQDGRAPAHAPQNTAHQEAAAKAPAPQSQWKVDAPKRDELVAQVQTALAERDLYDGVVDGVMGGGTVQAIKSFEQSQGLAQTGEASEKILAALLTAPMRRADAKSAAQPKTAAAPKTAAPKPAPAAAAQASQPATTGSTDSSPTLMAAQRALAKIGYGPVTIDGKMGTETRNAILSFEKDRGMPETGEPSPAVLRALQAMTGTPLR